MSQTKFTTERGESIKQHDICVGDLRLHYSLHETFIESEERASYSIAVTSDTDNVCAHDVSSLKDTALRLFDTVCHGEVTPCTLLDVLEDIL